MHNAQLRMMVRGVFLLLLFLFSTAHSSVETKISKRLFSHLLLNDPARAVEEGERFLKAFPESLALQKSLICALAARGEEIAAMEIWHRVDSSIQEESERRFLLEQIAWGTLKKGLLSSQQSVRMHALLGAAMTRNANAVPLIKDMLGDSSALLRSMAASLAGGYGDWVLQERLLNRLKSEKVWYVRTELIKSLGKFRMRESIDLLERIVANSRTLAEEKATAILSLSSIDDTIDRHRLQILLKNNRAGLRQLAVHLIAHFDLVEYVEGVFHLLRDTNPEVRLSALIALVFLPLDQQKQSSALEKILPLCKDADKDVSIAANWLAMRWGCEEGKKSLEHRLYHGPIKSQRMVAAALATTGEIGKDIVQKAQREHPDPFVRANLAFWSIGQRVDVEKACDELYNLLENKEDLWSWEQGSRGLFRSLSPSKAFHVEQVPNYPVVVDQLVSLDILSTLAKLRYPKANLAVKKYLKSSDWGVMGSAAATLLQEGDEQALELVEESMHDRDEKIRLQAALVCAFIQRNRDATEILQNTYKTVNRETKEHILEALSYIGDPKSIPFLLDILCEPFQNLRVIAASALIQCLNH